MPEATGHSRESLGLLNYLHDTLTQPLGKWEGFYTPLSPSMNFALRYQLAFASYALAAMSQSTPSYRAPYAEALRGAIGKMLDVAAWGYWRVPEGAAASGGHLAVLLSPHQRGPAGPPSDPIAKDNLQYSGHLGTMLGLYEKVSGDRRFDAPFMLHDPQSGVSYTYTHGQVAERIHAQMCANSFGGVCCEPGMAYVPCNNHALASNTLHDALHGTHYAEANREWLRTVRRKMVLRGPAVRGVFGASYVKDLHAAAPVAFNFTDAWGLAFMLPFDRPLVKKLYRRFRRKATWAGEQGAYVGSSSMSEKTEISDVPINTGFALVLANGIGDGKLASALKRYAASAFGPLWSGTHYSYAGAPRTLHTTALFALAEAVEPGGENFVRLFNDPPRSPAPGEPYLDQVKADGQVGVSRAEYDEDQRALHVELMQVGDPSALRDAPPADATLTFANAEGISSVTVAGEPVGQVDLRRDGGELSLKVSVPAEAPLSLAVR